MFVSDAMTVNPICILSEMKVNIALDKMNEQKLHRFPVVDQQHRLIGLITEGVILENTPSNATSLSIHELNYLLSKTSVESIMIRKVFTIGPDAMLEEAAWMMQQQDIGCLPVVDRQNHVLGIITVNDILNAFNQLLGYHVQGSRYVIRIEHENRPGQLHEISACFVEKNQNITHISTFYSPRGLEVRVISSGEDVDGMKELLTRKGFNVTMAVLQAN